MGHDEKVEEKVTLLITNLSLCRKLQQVWPKQELMSSIIQQKEHKNQSFLVRILFSMLPQNSIARVIFGCSGQKGPLLSGTLLWGFDRKVKANVTFGEPLYSGAIVIRILWYRDTKTTKTYWRYRHFQPWWSCFYFPRKDNLKYVNKKVDRAVKY